LKGWVTGSQLDLLLLVVLRAGGAARL